MLADLVEHTEVRTGRRSEGVFFSALTFIRKTNQGIGAFHGGPDLTGQWRYPVDVAAEPRFPQHR